MSLDMVDYMNCSFELSNVFYFFGYFAFQIHHRTHIIDSINKNSTIFLTS